MMVAQPLLAVEATADTHIEDIDDYRIAQPRHRQDRPAMQKFWQV